MPSKFGPKMLRLWKVTSVNLKIGKFPITLTVSNFEELFTNKFYLNSNKIKIIFVAGFIAQKMGGVAKNHPSPRVK